MINFLMAKIRRQEKTNFHVRRDPPNSIYSSLELNLRLLITVTISKDNNFRNDKLAPRSWPAFPASTQIIPCCILKEDIRIWLKLPLLAASNFPSLSQHSQWHMLAPEGFKGQQGVAITAA